MELYNNPKHTARIISLIKTRQVACFYQAKSYVVGLCRDLLTHCPVNSDGGDINVAVRREMTQIHKIKEVTMVTSSSLT